MKTAFLATLDRRFGQALRLVPVVCLVCLGLILLVNIAGRFSGVFSVTWFDEVVTALFAWMVFVGAAALWREREHFAIDLVPDLVRGSRAETTLRLLLATLGLIFASALAWYGGVFALRTTATTPILAVPQAWVYACIPFSGAVMAIYACRDLIDALSRAAPTGDGRPVLPTPRNPEMDRDAL
jgi:TRAP-type C4-dicarboxylate transport system permease small subunit